MSIGQSKLQQIAFWIVAGAISASAATLVTKSGKVLTNYTIQKQEGIIVIVSHQNGISKISIADLPDIIARRYVEPAVKGQLHLIMREKDPAKRGKKLEELVSKLPAAEEYVKEQLAQARQEKRLEDGLAGALGEKIIDERLRRLGQTLEQSGSFPHLAQRIQLLISEQKEKQGKLAKEIEFEIDACSNDKDPDAAVKRLQALLERHPNHPYSAKQQEYLEKANRLIAAKKSESSKREEQREVVRQKLRETWLAHTQLPPERTKWREIFDAFQTVEQALIQARRLQMQLAPAEAIPLVEEVIKRQPQIARFKGAGELRAKLEREKRQVPMVNAAIGEAKKAKSYEEAFQLLRKIIQAEPDAPNINSAEELLSRYERENRQIPLVKQAIKLANQAKTYGEAFRILENIIAQEPDAPNINDAKQLYAKYKGELQEKENARRRREEAEMMTCPACNGRGSVAQTGFTPGMASIGGMMENCSTCSGTGRIRRNTDARPCPVCNGRRSTRDVFTGRPVRCTHCGGAGFVAD